MLGVLGVYSLWKMAPAWTSQWLRLFCRCWGGATETPSTPHFDLKNAHASESSLSAHTPKWVIFSRTQAALGLVNLTWSNCISFYLLSWKSLSKEGFWNMLKHKLTESDYSQTEWQIMLSLPILPDRLTAALLSPASFLTASQINFPPLHVSLPWRGVQSPGYRLPWQWPSARSFPWCCFTAQKNNMKLTGAEIEQHKEPKFRASQRRNRAGLVETVLLYVILNSHWISIKLSEAVSQKGCFRWLLTPSSPSSQKRIKSWRT